MKKDIGIAVAGRALNLICLVSIMGLLARSISGGDFGVYMLILGTMPLAGVVMQFGLNQLLMRQVAEAIESNQSVTTLMRDGIKKILFVAICSASVFYFVVVYMLSQQAGIDIDSSVLMLGAIWGVLTTLQIGVSDLWRAFNFPARMFIYGETGSTVILLLALLAGPTVLPKLDLFSVMYLSIGTIFVLMILALVDLEKTADIHDKQSTSRCSPQQISYTGGLHIWAASSIALALYPIALWFIGYYGKAEQAGLFAVSSKLATLTVLPLLATNTLMPRRIVEYKLKNKGKLEIQAISAVAIVGGVFSIAVVAVLGDVLVKHWLGAQYQDAVLMAQWLQIGKIVTVFCGASGIILVVYNQERRFVEAGLLSVTVLLCLLFMPLPLDIMSRVIFATVASALVQSLYQFYHSRKAIGFFYSIPWTGLRRISGLRSM